MDWIIKLAIAAGAYLLADTAVEKTTGKHIHNHVFDWWAGIRDSLLEWANANNYGGVTRFVMTLDSLAVAAIRAGKHVRARISAQTPRGNTVVVDQYVDPAELMQKIPEFNQHQAVDITALVA